MTAKKLTATLGTGALSAGGAAGAAALKLGLLGGNRYFANATKFDKKAIGSSNWKAKKTTTNHGEISIEVEAKGEEGESWKCTIKGFVFGSGKDKSQIEEQVNKFVEEIKSDENKRKKFVKNCADARINAEKSEGKDSTIELEVDEGGEKVKLKDLDNLLNGDFLGLKRLEGNNLIKQENAEEWGFSAETEGKDKDKKIVVKLKKTLSDEFFCTIYENSKETNLNIDEFDYESSNKIFKGNSFYGEQTEEEKLSNLEKRKFLVRNCLENNKKIEGMKVVFDSSSKKWKIENLEELLLTKVYTNPGTKS